MMFKRYLIVILVSSFFYSPLWAQVDDNQQEGFKLVDRSCASVEGELILLSEIKRRQQRSGESFVQAQEQLKLQRSLFSYANTQLKHDLLSVEKAASDHIKKVMEANKFTKDEFEKKLESEYGLTFGQYQRDTKYLILENQVKASIGSKIEISDEQVEDATQDYLQERAKEFNIVFISIPYRVNAAGNKISGADEISRRNKKAKEVIKQIDLLKSLDKIKRLYSGDKAVLFSGPMEYQEGTLKPQFEKQLKKYASRDVTEPFVDQGVLTMMWKVRKNPLNEKLSKTALEKVRNSLYERTLERQFNTVVKSALANSQVETNCDG